MKIFLLSCIVIAAIFANCVGARNSSVTLMNISGDTINHVELNICKQHFENAAIGPAEAKTFCYYAKFDSDYELKFNLRNVKVKRNLGYVTNDLRFVDTIFISPDSIRISQRNNLYSK